MKNPLTLIAILISVSAASQQFQHAIGDTMDEVGNYVIVDNTGGYLIAGWTNSYSDGDRDIYLIATDSCGNLCHSRIIGDTCDDEANRIAAPTNGPYGLFGSSCSFRSGNKHDAYLVEVNSSLTGINFGKATGGEQADVGNDAILLSDGYLGVGATRSYGQGLSDVYVLRYNSSGVVQWSKTFGGTDHDFGEAVIQTSDGGFAICGSTASFGSGGTDVYLIKITSSGILQWHVVLGTTNDDYGYDLKQMADGGFVITGYTTNANMFPQSKRDLLLVRTDASGGVTWAKAYGGYQPEEGRKVIVEEETGFTVVGSTKSYGNGDFDVYVMRINLLGTVVWARTYGGEEPDEGRDIKATVDNGFIATGYTESFGRGRKDVYLIKMDQYGQSGCNQDTGVITWNVTLFDESGLDSLSGDSTRNGGVLDTIVSVDSIPCTSCDSIKCLRQYPDPAYRSNTFLSVAEPGRATLIFPNPAATTIYIRSDAIARTEWLEVVDMFGRTVRLAVLHGYDWHRIDVEGLPPGMYTVASEDRYLGRFVKL